MAKFYAIAIMNDESPMFVRKGGALGFGKKLWPTHKAAMNNASECGYDFEVVEVGTVLDRFPDSMLETSKIYVAHWAPKR